MVKYMKSKFEKYRENFDNMNHLLYISLVIDSRYKLQYLEYCFGYFVREKKNATNMANRVKDIFLNLYDAILKIN